MPRDTKTEPARTGAVLDPERRARFDESLLGFEGDGFRMRDACGPEGHVFQLRERTQPA